MNRNSLLAGALLLALAPVAALAQGGPIRIGVLNDQSGVFADYQGVGSVLAAQMAVEDFGGKAAGRVVEVVTADHQNKPDIGLSIARKWIDVDGVQAIFDLPNSAIALAVNQLVRDRNKVLIGSGAGTVALTGAQCSPNTVHWTYDTWAYGHGIGRAIYEKGGKTWFFITADYAFGHDLEAQTADEVKRQGGRVLGAVRHPIGANDYSSLLLQAQASGADVIAFANAGGDTVNSMKQAAEFGLAKKHKLVGVILGMNNLPGLGLDAAAGAYMMVPFYWDLNDGTRAWSRRFQARHDKKNMPNDMQAGVYASVLHYLKAIDKLGDASDGKAVVAAMKQMPTDDPLFGKGTIRADGRKLHPMYLLEVKSSAESKQMWDFLKVAGVVPADQAFRPLSEGKCPLVQ